MNSWYQVPQQSFPTDVTYPAPTQLIGPDLDKPRADIPSQRPEPAPNKSPQGKDDLPPKPDK